MDVFTCSTITLECLKKFQANLVHVVENTMVVKPPAPSTNGVGVVGRLHVQIIKNNKQCIVFRVAEIIGFSCIVLYCIVLKGWSLFPNALCQLQCYLSVPH